MKHKHADLIREWALDTSRVVQYKRTSTNEWADCVDRPSWVDSVEYRFKPEPKPDYHTYRWAMIKLTFDGETHQLKAAEVLK